METKKELELKHLAPYLPYGLKITFEGDDSDHEMVGIGLDGVKLLSPFNDYGSARFEDVKPLLHPLDRLTETQFQSELFMRFGGGVSEIGKETWLDGTTTNLMYSANTSISYSQMEFLLENHFDLFGLIEKGLAEPIKLDQ